MCEMMEGDLEIKDCEYDIGEVNLINWKKILRIIKIESIGISVLEVSNFKSLHYNTIAKILIFMLYSVTLGISNLLIKLSQG